MQERPFAIHTAAQIRALEQLVIERDTAGYELMKRAGAAAFDCLRRRWPEAKRFVVICGSGNNAGDGYVMARLARAAGFDVVVIALFDPSALQGDAATACQDFQRAGGEAAAWSDASLQSAEVVVDAIFGTGLSRLLDGRLCACVHAINASGKPVLALDIPSGLHADTGQVMGAAIKASCTITFVGLKIGLFVGAGQDHVGVLEFDSLGVADQGGEFVASRLEDSWLATVLPPRARTVHKGRNGRVLVIGGGKGMAGAVRLAGEAALRSGAGLVTVATCPENVPSVVCERPELMVRGVDSGAALSSLLDAPDVIAVGPGLGQDAWARSMWSAVTACSKPLVVDADALNLLAQQPQARGNWILTPHPGEAARLLDVSTAHIQADRLAAARAIAQRYNAIVVLKGAGSIVTRSDTPFICDAGNPGMATAGMGDVLTGVIAALHAQLGDAFVAARAGVLVHALAGDAAARDGQRGLIASDLFPHIRELVNPDA